MARVGSRVRVGAVVVEMERAPVARAIVAVIRREELEGGLQALADVVMESGVAHSLCSLRSDCTWGDCRCMDCTNPYTRPPATTESVVAVTVLVAVAVAYPVAVAWAVVHLVMDSAVVQPAVEETEACEAVAVAYRAAVDWIAGVLQVMVVLEAGWLETVMAGSLVVGCLVMGTAEAHEDLAAESWVGWEATGPVVALEVVRCAMPTPDVSM